MNDGVPSTTLGLVSDAISRARAMPKSMTRGPSEAMMMLLGFRSRCTTPNAWMAISPSASPAPRARTVSTGSGPCSRTAVCSDGPATYAVTSHGGSRT